MQWFYLDDERGLPMGSHAIIVPDYNSMIRTIELCTRNGIDFAIDFDHDIGDPFYSGYRIAQYIVNHNIPMRQFAIHSANAMGAQNIRTLLTEHGYVESRGI